MRPGSAPEAPQRQLGRLCARGQEVEPSGHFAEQVVASDHPVPFRDSDGEVRRLRWRENAEEWARRLPATFRGDGGSIAAIVIRDDANPRADYFVSRPGDFTINKPSL